MNPNTNALYISNYGSGIALGIAGDEDYIQLQFTRFLNYGAVPGTFKGDPENPDKGHASIGKLHKLSNNFAYFNTTNEKVLSALATHHHVKIQMAEGPETFENDWTELEARAQKLALEEFNEITREEFMHQRMVYVPDTFAVSTTN